MSLGFLKWPLRASFSGSAEQEAPSAINVNHVWLDALVEHPPSPDEPTQEFADYFACVEEAVRARQHVQIGPSGKVRTSAPLYELSDEDAAQKAETIFRSVFEHEGWSDESRETMDAAWKSVPRSLMKLSFSSEENALYTPATIYKTAQSKMSVSPHRPSAQVYNMADYRCSSSPTPPDDGGAAALVADAH